MTPTSEAGSSYRIGPVTVDAELAADGPDPPDGLVLSPGERQSYVSDTRGGCIRAHGVRPDGTLSRGDVFAAIPPGGAGCFGGPRFGGPRFDGPRFGGLRFDGLRFGGLRFGDSGRLRAATTADGVHCRHPDGTPTGRLDAPGAVANTARGGAKHNRLSIAADTALHPLVMGVTGTRPTGPGRRRRPWRPAAGSLRSGRGALVTGALAP
ncbi:SMP-30/gluconolactonase/LRE family protein [Streptomyces sp. NPDC093094]|uniref:SMP-30/gluconolactonase/LRE family protein n=1 Tax=Streptomyces sp. NPDC093094 TaxID=3366026 RepID=UPI0037FA1AAE